MNYFREFLLPLSGLGAGTHTYTFEIGREFFAHTPDSEVSDGKVRVNLTLHKQEGMVQLEFDIKGMLFVPCDRCLDEYFEPIEGSYRLILKYGDHFEEESDEVIILPLDQHKFDISTLLYEYMVLLLPMKKVHPDNASGEPDCNPDVINKLKEHAAPSEPDPRWDILKNLKTE